MDTGSRKFGLALGIATAAAAADQWEVACFVFAVYTVANVVLKLKNKEPEAAE